MKEKKTVTKIIIIAIVLIILAGVIMYFINGLNFDIMYSDTNRVQFNINKEFNIDDVKQITDEVLQGQEVTIQKVEVYEDIIAITTRGITDEQKQNLTTKINEKYGTELKAEDIKIETIPNIKLTDIAKRYIVPISIASAIIIIYLIIRYRKLGVGKVILQTIGIILLSQIVLASIIIIARIPVGRLTIPLVLTTYLLSLIGITTFFENKLKEFKEKEKEEQ